ncbi:hypothetical protein IQ13_2850 [Lacibacter cauensis]|uniref:Outer membrane protein with beta-barrel domain n=1 Tax=Lacibacter cauensis TaxID=510947 RepID=A0A562SHD1_9BACT|nr:hypothetical protein [Lacibacter cauensis]TWI80180.1 hypothetical protein IQ13_2850 [Lacibacter cauensis]
MLKPLILFALVICVHLCASAQETTKDSIPVADTIPVNTDSIEKEINQFLAYYDSLKAPRSYWLISIGGGNTQFSVKNLALNAQQSTANLSLTPTIGYYAKSGFGITYNNFLLTEQGKTQLLQHALTLSYDQLQLEKISYGFSYTRFFGKKEFVNQVSPYDNDFLAYIQFGKKKFTPGVMLGFSSGRYRETIAYLDSAQTRIPLTNQLVTYYYFVNDTSDIRLRDVSLIPYLRYQWQFDGFGKKDYFTLQPSFLALGSASSVKIDSKGAYKQTGRLSRSRSYEETYSQKTNFQFQSLGFQLDASWYIGKFFFNPQVYIDYYLLSSKYKWSSLFSVQTGFMF